MCWISLSKHEIDKYVTIPLYLLGEKNNRAKAYACIWRKLHLVDGLKANILIGNDIIGLKRISIDISSKSVYVSSCKIKLWIEAKQQDPFIWWKVLSEANVVLPPRTKKIIPFSIPNLFTDRDLLFHPSSAPRSLTLFSHLLDHTTTRVLAQNNLDDVVQIPWQFRLGLVSEVYYEICYMLFLKPNHAA